MALILMKRKTRLLLCGGKRGWGGAGACYQLTEKPWHRYSRLRGHDGVFLWESLNDGTP